MTDHETENVETANFETLPPPPPGPPPAAPPTEPHKRWRDHRVGVVALIASTAAALVIGGTLGAATGGLVGYGVGHHHNGPDGPNMVRMGFPGGAMPEGGPGQQFTQPNQIPPGTVPDAARGSSGSDS